MDADSEVFGDGAWQARVGALRRLALGMVRDGHEADELLQEVWLRAQGAAPRSRGWFATTLRNLIADRARSRARRTAHERAVAKGEAVPSAEEVLERLEAAGELTRELARLAEPYRLVLHLRYFEGLAPDEIARRLGEPREAVRTRLKRALAELRARMDRAHGGERRAWALALAPLEGAEISPGASTPLALVGAVGGMLMGTKLVGGVAVALTLALTWWLRNPDDRMVATPAVDAADLASTQASQVPSRARAAREPLLSPEPSPLPSAWRGRTIEVRIVLEDAEGTEHAHESGTLMVGLVTDDRVREARGLPFEDGRLAFELPPGCALAFMRLRVRGRAAILPEPVPIVPGDEPLVVRGKWLKRGGLQVVDADSKAELSDIEVRYADGWRANPSWTHPGDHRSLTVLVEHGTSPIELPERKLGTPYWVHAPGHAWTRIDFVHETGGESTVELSAARGTVEVMILGAPPAGAFVRLYPLATTGSRLRPANLDFPSYAGAVSMSLAAHGPTRIEDFEPGRYLAALETGEYEDRVRLGTLEFEFTAGETARIAIPLDPLALDAPKTHLVGTLRVPPELVGARQQVRLERLEKEQPDVYLWIGEMDESEDDETLLEWDAGLVRTGTWIANLPHQYRIKFEADIAGGESRVALVMPPLGTITLEVVDAATGAALVPKRLNWSLAPLEGVSHSTSSGAMRTGPGGAWQIVAPQGMVRIYAQQPGFLEAERELELAHDAHVRLELARATGLRLLLRDGEAALNPDFSWSLNVTVRDAAGSVLMDKRSLAGEIGSRILPGAGRYTITFPPLDGYRPLPALTVDVAAEEVLDVLVPLERAP
jgi:RNA polymerase sigma-70 factor (ECF subfamily)